MTPRTDGQGGERERHSKEAPKVEVISTPTADGWDRLRKALDIVLGAASKARARATRKAEPAEDGGLADSGGTPDQEAQHHEQV